MATVLDSSRFLERPVAIGTLLDSVVANTNGTWFEVSGARPLNVTIEATGTFNATCEVRGSCAPSVPANTIHGALIASATTGADSIVIDAGFKWIKVRVTGYVSGTINAYCFCG